MGVGWTSKSDFKGWRLFRSKRCQRILNHCSRSKIDNSRVLQCLSPSRDATPRRSKRAYVRNSVSLSRMDVRASWKLIFENYSECYHCPGVHPALSKLTPYDSAENDLADGPFLGGFMRITKGNSLTMSGNACALPVGDIKGEDHNRVFYYSIFPNMLLSMHPDYVMVHQLWSKSPERTLIFCDWFFHP